MIARQLFVTTVFMLFIILLFEWFDIDIWLQDKLYNFDTQQWAVNKNNIVLKIIFYDGVKKLYVLLVLMLFVSIMYILKVKKSSCYTMGLVIVLLSIIFVGLVVGEIKNLTNTPCPKHISHYDGEAPYVTVLSGFPSNYVQERKYKCFPAGHASGGFALMSLFFLFKRKRNRVIALISAVVLGWSLGRYKMLIGDHFFSHTLVSMLLAWLIILITTKSVYMCRTRLV